MVKIRLFGWRIGLDTVKAIKRICELTGCPLAEALAAVNKVLDDQEAIIELPNREAAPELIHSLTSLGMLSEVIPDNRPLEQHAKQEIQ